jgi:hypothetical protein
MKVNGMPYASDVAQVFANGDRHLQAYLRDPMVAPPAHLLAANNPASIMASEKALEELKNGNLENAMMLLDVAGSSFADHLLADIGLIHLADKTTTGASSTAKSVVNALAKECNPSDGRRGDAVSNNMANVLPSSSIAALTQNLVSRQVNGKVSVGDSGECQRISDEEYRKWICPLAPSLQQNAGLLKRARATVVPELKCPSMEGNAQIWSKPMSDSNHVWYVTRAT